MADSSWSAFTKRIPIRASVERVYKAWTTQDALESWFLRKAVFTKPDGSKRGANEQIHQDDEYVWNWHGYADSVLEKRKIVSANGRDKLQFTFSGDCLVTVAVRLVNGETVCELTQENIPADNNPKSNLYVGCGEGWTFYLANLKSILEGGVDLRNKNESLQSVINS